MGARSACNSILAFNPPFLADATLFPLNFFGWDGRAIHQGSFPEGWERILHPEKKPGFPGLLLIHGGPSRTNKEPFSMMTTGLNRLIEPTMSSSL